MKSEALDKAAYHAFWGWTFLIDGQRWPETTDALRHLMDDCGFTKKDAMQYVLLLVREADKHAEVHSL